MRKMGKRGPKPRLPTDEERKTVERAAAVGLTAQQIAKLIGRAESSTWEYFGEILSRAGMQANANVAGALYKAAMSGNVTAQIFWCKTRLRWTETEKVEHSGNINATPVLNFILPPDKK